jgi:molybdate transport system substrate-binding protein
MKMKNMVVGAMGLGLALGTLAHAGEVRVISSVGVRAALEQLKPEFERVTSHKLTLTYGSAIPLKRRVDAGEAFDVVILTPAMIEDLVKQGRVAAGSTSEVAKVGMGVAGRAGAFRPDISTAEAFKRSLLNAKSIVYSKEGQSGTFMAGLIERLGLAAQMTPKTVIETRSGHTAIAVVEGKAELGFSLISEILPVAGAEYVGPLPAALQSYVVFTAGVATNAGDAQAAKAFIQFFSTAPAVTILKASGMEPG